MRYLPVQQQSQVGKSTDPLLAFQIKQLYQRMEEMKNREIRPVQSQVGKAVCQSQKFAGNRAHQTHHR